MKHLMILTIGVCLLFAAMPVMAQSAADEAAVREAVEKLVATFNTHDMKAMVALMDETSVPWESRAKGSRERQEQYFTEYFAIQKNVNSKITEEVGIVFVTPDVAIYKAYADVTGIVDDDGKAMPLAAKVLGAWVAVKKGGNWLMAAYFGRPVEE
jgi:uncharacterized protein (TIGR02246 family)